MKHGLAWKVGLNLLALFYIIAGINHFMYPAMYLHIMPPAIPWHLPLVYISGVIEILLGALVMLPRYRQMAAWGIIVLLIAIFPANIYHAIIAGSDTATPVLYAYLRLPVQLLFIAWAWVYTKE